MGDKLEINVAVKRWTGSDREETVAGERLSYEISPGHSEATDSFIGRVQQEASDAISRTLVRSSEDDMRDHLKREIDNMTERELREAAKRLDRSAADFTA